MAKLRIKGGASLNGDVYISGSKNAAVGAIAATLLADDVSVLENVPYIRDVFAMRDILQSLGAKADMPGGGKMIIDPRGMNTYVCDRDLAMNLRASYYFLGVLLHKFGRARISLPGGCQIGSRPTDLTEKAIQALNAPICVENGEFVTETTGLKGAGNFYLDFPSVGATINMMLTAVCAEGRTVINNPAREPHVTDVANLLNMMGGKIRGAGTNVIRITGVPRLHGANYTIVPDYIETGTMMIIAAATKGDITIRNAIPSHQEALISKMNEMGIQIRRSEDVIRVTTNQRPRPVDIKTQPFPGFPTDLQQPIAVLLAKSTGTSQITETIFEDRYRYLDEIVRMGARVRMFGGVAQITGVSKLTGTRVFASDLRASASLVIAGLMAEGVTEIENIEYLERGYENMVGKLRALGADIEYVN